MRYALLIFSVLLFSACEVRGGSNEFTFVNKSQYDVENIWGAADDVIPLLRPGESVTTIVHWPGTPTSILGLRFYINGKVYGTQVSEEIEEAEGYRVKSDREVFDGDSFTVTIYSDQWWAIRKN
jgi:hypothetical protein